MTHPNYRQLPDGRWQRIPIQEQPEPIRCWYMRDNCTFRRLPLDVEAALVAIRQEFEDGQTGGMLCGDPRPLLNGVVHAPSSVADWPRFEAVARFWLDKAVELSKPPGVQA